MWKFSSPFAPATIKVLNSLAIGGNENSIRQHSGRHCNQYLNWINLWQLEWLSILILKPRFNGIYFQVKLFKKNEIKSLETAMVTDNFCYRNWLRKVMNDEALGIKSKGKRELNGVFLYVIGLNMQVLEFTLTNPSTYAQFHCFLIL